MRSRTSSGFCTFATAVKHTVETGSLVAEFFGPGFQTRDAVPLVSPFVCFYTLIHVRLAPPEQAVDKGGQFPSGGKYSHISSNQSRGLAIVRPKAVSLWRSDVVAIRSGAVVCRERRSRAFGCSTAGMLTRTARQLSELRCR